MAPPTKLLCLAAVLTIALAGCQAAHEQLRPPALSGQGELYVYMEAFPREAARLEFGLDRIYAVAGDGSLVPLDLRASRFTPVLDSGQRLAAWGVLDPGRYKGLAFKVKEAGLAAPGGGRADMLVPGKPVLDRFPFTVKKKGAVVISLTLAYGGSVKKGFSFTPDFSLKIPVKPVDAALGYVVNYGSNDITVFNKASMEVTGVIPTGAGPSSMILNPRTERGYVSLSRGDAIDVVDMVSGSIIGRIRLNTGDSPAELAITPDGKTLFSVNSGSNTVSVINPLSYIETGRIQVGLRPVSISLDRTGTRAWVFNYFSNNVSIIDVNSDTVVATLNTDLTPLRGEFSKNGESIYIINKGSPFLTVVNPVTLATVQRKYAGMGMTAIKVDTNTDLIYIGKEGDPYIEIYDPFTLSPQDYIKAGSETRYMAIDGDEDHLCAVDPAGNSLFFINLASRKIVSKIDVGKYPVWVALVGER